MTLYYPTSKEFVQTTLGAALGEGITASATLGSTASTLGVQDKNGIMIIDRVDANGNATPTKAECISFEGTSSSTVTTLVRGLGGTTDQDHAVGAVVEFGPTAVWAEGLIDFFDEEHNTDGTHKPYAKTVVAYTPSAAATATLDVSAGDIHSITMPAGNITIDISNETTGQCFLIEITQDAIGSRTVTWFSTIRWSGGTAPTLTTTASKRDTFGFRVTGSNTYDGFIVGQNV